MPFLDPATLTFARTPSGYLSLAVDGADKHKRAECVALFPFSQPGHYISVGTRKDGKLEEIGVIEDLGELPPDQRTLVERDVDFHLFTPRILDVKKVDNTFGVSAWNVVTDRGERTFYVRDAKENVRLLDEGLVIITDIEKCRYRIADYRRLPARARSKVENTLLH